MKSILLAAAKRLHYNNNIKWYYVFLFNWIVLYRIWIYDDDDGVDDDDDELVQTSSTRGRLVITPSENDDTVKNNH